MADKKANESVMGCVAVLFAVPLNWMRWAVEAWCFSIIWGWFAVPLGAPVVGVLPAFGILVLAGMASHGGFADSQAVIDTNKKLAESLGTSDGVASLSVAAVRLAFSPAVLGVCWVARWAFS